MKGIMFSPRLHVFHFLTISAKWKTKLPSADTNYKHIAKLSCLIEVFPHFTGWLIERHSILYTLKGAPFVEYST